MWYSKKLFFPCKTIVIALYIKLFASREKKKKKKGSELVFEWESLWNVIHVQNTGRWIPSAILPSCDEQAYGSVRKDTFTGVGCIRVWLTFCSICQDDAMPSTADMPSNADMSGSADRSNPMTSDDVDKMQTKVASPPVGNDILFIANITYGAMKYMGIQVRGGFCTCTQFSSRVRTYNYTRTRTYTHTYAHAR